MLRISEDILLIISLAGCAVILFFMIKRLHNVLEYKKHKGLKVVTLTDGKIRRKRGKSSIPAPGWEGVVYEAGKDRENKRTGLYFSFSKQSESHPKRDKVCAGKQPVSHSAVR